MLFDIFNRTAFLLSVPKCVFCGEKLDYTDRCLCKSCKEIYENQKERNCSRCAKKLNTCDCTSEYLLSHYVKRVIKVYRYDSKREPLPGDYLIYSLKQDNRRDVFAFLADELCEALRSSLDFDSSPDSYIITNVPRRPAAIRSYGYDHSSVLAKYVSKRLGIRYVSLLKSRARKPQKETGGDNRLKNVNIDYRKRRQQSLKGKSVIIIDDIITTGASMGSCAAMIRALGTRKIIGACLAVAYKDMYTPFAENKK